MFIIKTRAAMENKDKIYDQFKEAATTAEKKGFDRTDAVWNRVEEKLDKKKERHAAIWWKYSGIAALLLLFMGIGTYMFNDNDPVLAPKALPKNIVTVIDTEKVKEIVGPRKQEVVIEDMNAKKQDDITTHSTKNKSVRYTSQSSNPSQPVASIATVPSMGLPFVFFPLDGTGDSNTIAEEGETINKGYLSKATNAFSEIAKEEIDVKKASQELQNTMPGITKDARGNTLYSGTVTSTSDGFPIPGLSVRVKGSTTEIQTDVEGKYQIKANIGDILVFSYVGIETKEIRIEKDITLDIAMNDNSQSLEEVVVVGYGHRNKSAERKVRREERKKEKEKAPLSYQPAPATSARGTITSKIHQISDAKAVNSETNTSIAVAPKRYRAGDVQLDGDKDGIDDQLDKSVTIAGKPSATLAQTLQGQIPGLNITTFPGVPGSNNAISIRGVSSIQTGRDLLYVIDGKIANSNAFTKIDAVNIESISVIKDANATSIYGSRASNGVIVIKTKKLSRKQKRAIKEAIKEDKEAGYIDNTTGQFIPIDKIKIDQEEYESFEENKFENSAIMPLSTFSIDVDNASYTNIRRFINNGQTVPKDAVRVEEMINFFKYNYPQPTGNDPFSISTEYSDAPWNPKHKLLKIGLQGREIVTKDLPASNFVFLIDVSGSMNEPNKLPLLKQSMKILINQMRPKDKIAIVVYAGAAGLVLPSTSVADKDRIIAALDNLNAGGSTAGGAGIELAYATAQANFIKGGNNRVILATDGDFNVGASTDSDMESLIDAKRKSGVFLTCLGYGMGNYKDSKLETLADKGNGNYAYIDNMQEAGRFLDKEFKGSMYAIAKDVKIQIEFNPKHVQSYRLIGYENRKLRDEDFVNDTVDAGELGSGHTVTALYEIIPAGVKSDYFTTSAELKYSQPQSPAGNYNNELATIKFRHKKPDEDKSEEIVMAIPNTITTLEKATADFKFAAAVAWFGLKLRDSKLIPLKDSEAIRKLARHGQSHDPDGYRAEFVRLTEMVE
jgi:Ca-activated chloride channel family protein